MKLLKYQFLQLSSTNYPYPNIQNSYKSHFKGFLSCCYYGLTSNTNQTWFSHTNWGFHINPNFPISRFKHNETYHVSLPIDPIIQSHNNEDSPPYLLINSLSLQAIALALLFSPLFLFLLFSLLLSSPNEKWIFLFSQPLLSLIPLMGFTYLTPPYFLMLSL